MVKIASLQYSHAVTFRGKLKTAATPASTLLSFSTRANIVASVRDSVTFKLTAQPLGGVTDGYTVNPNG